MQVSPLFVRPLLPAPTAKRPNPRFGLNAPLSILIHQNEPMSRLFIELTGYAPWVIGFARNKYERLEKVLDEASWVTLGVFGPIVFDKIANKLFVKHLQKKFPTLGLSRNSLNVPLEWFDANHLHPRFRTASAKTLAAFDMTGIKALSSPQLGKLLGKLRSWKLMIIAADLLIMGGVNQAMFPIRNYLTEYLSKQKGFSGEFGYASKQYTEQQTKQFALNKTPRNVTSWILGLGIGGLGLPTLLNQVLQHTGSKGLGRLKPMLKLFNYHNAMYMSKWVLLWGTLFNYNAAMLLFARDKHELRENISKMLSMDFFYFVGDDLINRVLAKRSEQKQRGKGLHGVRLLESSKWFNRTFWTAKSLPDVYKAVGYNAKHLAYKQAAQNSWISLALTALCLGISTPLINNWYTQQKVLREQRAMPSAENNRPLQPTVQNKAILTPYPYSHASPWQIQPAPARGYPAAMGYPPGSNTTTWPNPWQFTAAP